MLQAQDIAAVKSDLELSKVVSTEKKVLSTTSTEINTSTNDPIRVASDVDLSEKLRFSLDVRSDYNVLVQVIDNYDNLVYEGTIHNTGNFVYDANLLLPGIYSINVSNSEFFMSKRFVKHPKGIRVLK